MISFLMATAEDPRVAFTIGNLQVRWYAVIIVSGMILALIYACTQCKKINLAVEDTVELFLWIIPFAVVFGRLIYVLTHADDYFPVESWDDFVECLALWHGGITIIGGILGGLIGGSFFILHHRKETNFLRVADLVVVPLLIGQILGRVSNFANQEAFGLPITNPKLWHFPFAIYIDDPSGVADDFTQLVYDHVPGYFCATFFYESMWNLVGMIFLIVFWAKGKNKKYEGFMLWFYIFWYFLGRFWLEFLRIDAVPIAKVACGIVFSLAAIIGGLHLAFRCSLVSYRYVRRLAEEGRLDGAPLKDYDVKNYIFVTKVVKSKNPLRILYAKGGHVDVDFDAVDYYHVPKNYKSQFKKFERTAAFCLA